MRVAIGALMQETNSFSPVKTTLRDFEAEYLLRDRELLDYFPGTNTEIAGFLSACDSVAGVQVVPTIAAAANSGGNVTDDAFSALSGELADRLVEATHTTALQAVLLALHGSMCVDGEQDPEGALLLAVRDAVGDDCVIAATLDLHANVTERMASAADILVGYRTYPHVDQARTGERAAAAALSMAADGTSLTTVLQKAPMIVPAEHMQTTHGPMHELRAEADWIEAEGLAAVVSIFGVQPWLDVPGTGCSVVVVAHEKDAGRVLARDLALKFWRRRDRFAVELADVQSGVGRALAANEGPVILVESADSPSSGAPGDSAAVLKALIEAAPSARRTDGLNLVPVVDPDVVRAAGRAGLGNTLTTTVGGRLDPARSTGVELTASVEHLGDGKFIRMGPAFTGLPLDAGPIAVLAAGAIQVLVTSRAVPTSDPELYRSAGLDPMTARTVVVKSPTLFRAAYERFAREIVYLDTPGAASANLREFEWKNLVRPIYPLDEFEWSPD